jgi:hypothetical protein
MLSDPLTRDCRRNHRGCDAPVGRGGGLDLRAHRARPGGAGRRRVAAPGGHTVARGAAVPRGARDRATQAGEGSLEIRSALRVAAFGLARRRRRAPGQAGEEPDALAVSGDALGAAGLFHEATDKAYDEALALRPFCNCFAPSFKRLALCDPEPVLLKPRMPQSIDGSLINLSGR